MTKTLRFDADYASEVMETIPSGYIDKTVCGCGLTTIALENNEDTVIAVPTIYLALNKSEQYPNKRFNGKVLAVYGETSLEKINYYWQTTATKKIMVTYDSLPKVQHLLDKCRLIIDESNELLSRTKLKPEVIDKVFTIAKKYKNSVSFISATPTPLKYMPEWISEIDQVKIEWSRTVKSKPIICERTFPFKSLKNEFIIPLKEQGTMTVAGMSFSKLIIFINSIKQIVEIVKESGLDKDECGIICGDNLKNDIKIRGINRYFSGVIPRYLFITASGFSGIDLQDNEAMTVVVSNTRDKWKMIDMLTDLKQAVSRQRNKSNPTYGSFIYIYNQTIFKKPEEELLQQLEATYQKINESIALYDLAIKNNLPNGFVPYPDFSAYTFFKNNRYIINNQAFCADAYFIMETRKQYTKGFDIKSSLGFINEVEPIKLSNDVCYKDLVRFFNATHKDGKMNWSEVSNFTKWISLIELSYKYYQQTWLDQSYAKQMVENYGKETNIIKTKISKKISVGKRYARKEAKKMLQDIYDLHNISRKAKHSDFDGIFKKVRHRKCGGEWYLEILEK